ncbi:hypothetical protein RN001_010319 [Aquatica leii]|uniref:Uncharacterized protein n=1 Tax=Aquatica leii TaxID=1421715 RepID=A0AAN7SN95_9COLE|nr:hypothetical protein RN001_010319 [Aquatica leii]
MKLLVFFLFVSTFVAVNMIEIDPVWNNFCCSVDQNCDCSCAPRKACIKKAGIICERYHCPHSHVVCCIPRD